MNWQDSGADAAYLIHDADSRFTAQFDAILKSEGVQPIRLHPGRLDWTPVELFSAGVSSCGAAIEQVIS